MHFSPQNKNNLTLDKETRESILDNNTKLCKYPTNLFLICKHTHTHTKCKPYKMNNKRERYFHYFVAWMLSL